MKGEFSRDSFDEGKHYSQVLLQQSRVQLEADWNEAAAIADRRDERALQDVVGPCGSPNDGFRIAARQTLDGMKSTARWDGVGAKAELCVDYIDRLRGTASLRVAKVTQAIKPLPLAIDLTGADDLLSFAVKSANPESGAQYDTGFTFFVADAAGRKATWAVAALKPLTVGVWRVYTCPLAAAAKDVGLQLADVRAFGFADLKTDWVYHFDLVQRDFAPLSVPLQDVLALDDVEAIDGWSVPAPGTGSVGLDAGTLFEGRSTLQITGGPGDGVKSFGEARDLRAYTRVITVTNRTANPNFFLKTQAGLKLKLQNLTHTTSGGWTTYVGDIPADPNLKQIAGYGFEVGAGIKLNVAQVLAILDLAGNFFILGGQPGSPGRMVVDGIACQKEVPETYYSQASYPEALPLEPVDNRVDLIFLDVWQRHVTYIEDPALREVALGGPDTCTRVQTVAQVKVLKGDPDASDARLDCAIIPPALMDKYNKLLATGRGTLSTLVAPPGQSGNLCEIAPDTDFLGLDNRLYRVEIHDPGAAGKASFKWSRDNGAIAVAVVEDAVPATDANPQTIRVERLGRDRATTLAVNDWIEISDDRTDLSDSDYDAQGLPVRQVGELHQVKAVSPDTAILTLDSKLAHSYAVARHAKVRKWDGAGPNHVAKAFVSTTSTPQLDLGDGVQISFGGQQMLSGDYWQFTARGITGQIERLDNAPPAGIVHHYCPLALIKWKSNAVGGFEIADVADCRRHFPALTAIQATDVAYDDSCCGLTVDVKTLAAAHGDLLDPNLKVSNVQQALDALCAREQEYLTLRYVGGDGQEGQPGAVLPAELIVAVENSLGEPAAGVTVKFEVVPIGGNVASSGGVSAAEVETDADGEASVGWTLGPDPGLNLASAVLDTPQAGQPEVIFNARGVVPAVSGGLCTITVGDGVISHGDFNGPDALRHALLRASDQGGGTICLLRGTHLLTDNIVLDSGRNIVIQGNKLEALVLSVGFLPLVFDNCIGIELHDLRLVVQDPTGPEALNGIIRFAKCAGVVVKNCLIEVEAREGLDTRPVALVLIEGGLSPFANPNFEPPAFDDFPLPGGGNRPRLLNPARALVHQCQFTIRGNGPFHGIALRQAVSAWVIENLVQMFMDNGGYGITLEDDSDLCWIAHNTIVGVPFVAGDYNIGALAGIHLGSGCDQVVIQENQVLGGAGFGIDLGSVDDERGSLGGMRGAMILGNRIERMALNGIGIHPFQLGGEGGLMPVTDDLLVRGNHIENCAFGKAQRIDIRGRPFLLAAGVALWMGENITLEDNQILENGHTIQPDGSLIDAPHPVAGVIVLSPGRNLALRRNQILNNFSNNFEFPGGMIAFRDGFVIESSDASQGEVACSLEGNHITAPFGRAIAIDSNGDAIVQIQHNHLEGREPEGRAPEASVVVDNQEGRVVFNSNHVLSRLETGHPVAVRIQSQHTTFNANQCVCLGELGERFTHVLLEPNSASATGNHCLETEIVDPDLGVSSLRLGGTRDARVAVGNITTNGVVLDPPNPPGDLANMSGIKA